MRKIYTTWRCLELFKKKMEVEEKQIISINFENADYEELQDRKNCMNI